MNITWVPREELLIKGTEAIRHADVVLDIGCGIMPQRYVIPNIHICCEPYEEYVEHLTKKIKSPENKGADYLVFKMGWQDVVKYFPENSVDTIFLIDVIEHLEKEESRNLLLATQKIARSQVIVFTPWGFMPQHHSDGKDAWGLDGAIWQEHLSGWLPEDFDGDGWEFIASKDFHLNDNLNKSVKKPYGAFWAIKTNSEEKGISLIKSKIIAKYRHTLRRIRVRLSRLELKVKQKFR